MSDENLAEIVAKKAERKPNLRINGGEKLHPIYEAVVALFKEQFSDKQILKIINTEGELRKVLALDALVDSIPPEEREEFKEKISNAKSYEEIVNTSVLYIAKSRKLNTGEVLQPVSGLDLKKDALRALRKTNPDNVYIKERSISDLEKSASKIRKRRIRRIISAAILSVGFGLGIYGLSGEIKEDAYLLANKVQLSSRANQLSGQISKLETEIKTAEAELEGTKGFQIYEMGIEEYKKPNALQNKVDEINKTTYIDRLIFVYNGANLDKVKIVYKKTEKQ